MNIKNELGKSFIKDARLNLKRDLRTLQLFLQVGKSSCRTWRNVNAIADCQYQRSYEKKRENAEKLPHPDTARFHSGNLAVGGEAAQAEQDSDEHARGQRDIQRSRNDEEEKFNRARQWRTVPDHKFEDLPQLAGENDECENCGPDQRVRGDFAENVAREDPHGGNTWSLAWGKDDGMFTRRGKWSRTRLEFARAGMSAPHVCAYEPQV